jgi:thiol:disulfide interchange protein
LQAGQAEAGEAGQILAELGSVTLFFSQAELDLVLEEHSDRLVVVEASLTWCRPCKGFEKTFQVLSSAANSVANFLVVPSQKSPIALDPISLGRGPSTYLAEG